MQPWERLGTARTPAGTELVLTRRGDEFVVRAGGHVLMSSRQHGSEEAMAQVVAPVLGRAGGQILVGGLGLGYTLRAVLEAAASDAVVTVAELVAELVAWNRGPLASLAGHPLDDRRVCVDVGDVAALLSKRQHAFDVVLLDVDNGPTALVDQGNDRLYGRRGLARLFESLRRGGVAVVWSAGPDADFERRASAAGFRVRLERPHAQGSRGVRHALFVLQRP